MEEKIKLDDVALYPYNATNYQEVYRGYYQEDWSLYKDDSLKTMVAIKGLYLEATRLLKNENKKDVEYATKTIELLEIFVNAFAIRIKLVGSEAINFPYQKLTKQQQKLFDKGSYKICNAFDKRFKKLYQAEKKQTEENQQKMATQEENQQKTAVEKLKKL